MTTSKLKWRTEHVVSRQTICIRCQQTIQDVIFYIKTYTGIFVGMEPCFCKKCKEELEPRLRRKGKRIDIIPKKK